MKCYDIWTAELSSPVNTHVQSGYRPVVIVSNDMANKHSPVVTVIPLTSRQKKPLPTHVLLSDPLLKWPSTALCEQIFLQTSYCILHLTVLIDSA